MCGICGFWNLETESNDEMPILEKMMAKLVHRGPDDSGYHKNNIYLGFTRLSIIGINNGLQPINNEDNTLFLVCNGEVFNYIELKRELIRKGHRFQTETDVEVILHLYEDFGFQFFDMLNGQFAFAIFDTKKQILFCARDHVGIAPFFYTNTRKYFIFASEIKSILEHPAVQKSVDQIGFDQMLTFPGLISPRTMFQNIHSLKHGHYIIVDNAGKIEDTEYWDLIYPEINAEIYKDDQYYIDLLDVLISQAVKLRLHADTPVGCYLSGGLDSSTIASKANASFAEGKLNTFSVNFNEKRISENKYQQIVSDYLNTNHHEITFDNREIVDLLKTAVYHSESPLKETYNTSSMALSKLVKDNNVKVVLSGEGADELFAGYVGYRFDKLRQADPGKEMPAAEKEILRHLWGDEHFMYEKEYSSYSQIKNQLYSKRFKSENNDIINYQYPIINKNRIHNIDLLHKRSYIDFTLRVPDHLLSDHGDRMLYANSVEGRYPFLDKELIEFARFIPPHLKLKGYNEKYILKKIAKGILPDEIIRRQKFSYVAPGSVDLLKQDNEYINYLLSYEQVKKQGYFNPDTVEQLVKKYKQDGFRLNLPFEDDLLIIVITFCIFLDVFNMPDL